MALASVQKVNTSRQEPNGPSGPPKGTDRFANGAAPFGMSPWYGRNGEDTPMPWAGPPGQERGVRAPRYTPDAADPRNAGYWGAPNTNYDSAQATQMRDASKSAQSSALAGNQAYQTALQNKDFNGMVAAQRQAAQQYQTDQWHAGGNISPWEAMQQHQAGAPGIQPTVGGGGSVGASGGGGRQMPPPPAQAQSQVPPGKPNQGPQQDYSQMYSTGTFYGNNSPQNTGGNPWGAPTAQPMGMQGSPMVTGYQPSSGMPTNIGTQDYGVAPHGNPFGGGQAQMDPRMNQMLQQASGGLQNWLGAQQSRMGASTGQASASPYGGGSNYGSFNPQMLGGGGNSIDPYMTMGRTGPTFDPGGGRTGPPPQPVDIYGRPTSGGGMYGGGGGSTPFGGAQWGGNVGYDMGGGLSQYYGGGGGQSYGGMPQQQMNYGGYAQPQMQGYGGGWQNGPMGNGMYAAQAQNTGFQWTPDAMRNAIPL